MARTWFTVDEEMVQGNTPSIVQTWSSGGSATDVSGWDITFKAEGTDSTNSDTISIAPGAVVKSSSGGGTTDTFTIPFSASNTNITVGRYNYEILRVIGSDVITITKGVLTIFERKAVAA